MYMVKLNRSYPWSPCTFGPNSHFNPKKPQYVHMILFKQRVLKRTSNCYFGVSLESHPQKGSWPMTTWSFPCIQSRMKTFYTIRIAKTAGKIMEDLHDVCAPKTFLSMIFTGNWHVMRSQPSWIQSLSLKPWKMNNFQKRVYHKNHPFYIPTWGRAHDFLKIDEHE